MKFVSLKPSVAGFAGLLTLVSLLSGCSVDLPNPNAAPEEETLNSREGLLGLSVGLRQVYSTQALDPIILTTGTTAREVKGTTTFFNITELEQGGPQLSPNNANTSALFARNYRVIRIADQLIDAAPRVLAEAPIRSGVLAHAYLFKAAALAGVASGFAQGPLTATDGTPAYVSRQQLLAEGIRLLDLATQELAANPPSAEFNTTVLGSNFSLPNTVQAYRARLNLRAGNYAAALTAANLVNLDIRSEFSYSAQNPNPVFQAAVLAGANFRPRHNFGLSFRGPDSLVNRRDRRLAFYMSGPAVRNTENGSVDSVRTLAGFFGSVSTPIPAYLPDEIRLIRAEANLRAATPDLAAALADINLVRTQTTGDLFGVHAGLPPYRGPVTVQALLLEVYRQRSAELFLSGQRLEDSRRFGRPEPPANLTERNRDFYPYPQQERVNNPNTPADPTI